MLPFFATLSRACCIKVLEGSIGTDNRRIRKECESAAWALLQQLGDDGLFTPPISARAPLVGEMFAQAKAACYRSRLPYHIRSPKTLTAPTSAVRYSA
jgi:hypothetical protein